jgi:uncharacterized protein YcbK (DUF882 family)
VPVDNARARFFATAWRAGLRLGTAGFVLLAANAPLQNAVADGDTETLSFHHVHTNEDITITFKRNGRYDEAALEKLNWFMRDWRKQKETRMDPHLFDLLWHVYREVDATKPINIICGYRSPGTNAMLRRRSGGVARFSQHILGHAIDFFIPGVPLAKLRAVGLQLQRGGVGFYPTSGSPFVHMDTGTIRHWPSIPRQQLVKIFPHGRTVHIPRDGKPLPGYAKALAEVENHGNVPNARSLAAAREAGMITAKEERVAELVAQGRIEKLVAVVETGRNKNEKGEPGHKHAVQLASLTPPKPVTTQRIVPMPSARPTSVVVASAKRKPAAQPIQTAALTNRFDDRGIWPSEEEIAPALPAAIAKGTTYQTASLDPTTTGSTGYSALAFAATGQTSAAQRVRPMGSHLPHLPAEARVMPASSEPNVVVQPPLATAMQTRRQPAGSGSPWLRAAMLTPSVSYFMTTTRSGQADTHGLQALMHKPHAMVMMSFSADPQLGMVADRFSGHAVVFMATASFNAQTASLR